MWELKRHGFSVVSLYEKRRDKMLLFSVGSGVMDFGIK